MSGTYKAEKTKFVAGLVEDKCDPILGKAVRGYLASKGLETSFGDERYDPGFAFDSLVRGVYHAYKSLGLDVDNDPSIIDTPRRFAKMFVGELTKGLNYDFFPKCTATPNGVDYLDQAEFDSYVEERLEAWNDNPYHIKGANLKTREDILDMEATKLKKMHLTSKVGAVDEAVIVKKIRITSLCEHHLQTIDGYAHIAYIPSTKVMGLSKFARVAEFFAARPQIQERMTEQVYHALSLILETEDIGVVIDATHFCMRARGVRQPESTTQTNKFGGRFMTVPELRKEFLDAIA